MIDLEVMLALASAAASLGAIIYRLNRFRGTRDDQDSLHEAADD